METAVQDKKLLAVTRPLGKGMETAELVRKLGHTPHIVHTVELTAKPVPILARELRTAFSEPVDWLVFMSPEGVRIVIDILKDHPIVLPSRLGDVQVLAVGEKTREALETRGLTNVSMPRTFTSTGIADHLVRLGLEQKHVLLARSSEADEALANRLEEAGARVTTIRAYTSALPEDHSSVKELVEALQNGMVEGVLFTSASSATNLFLIAGSIEVSQGDLIDHLAGCLIGAIGPVTWARLSMLGVEPDILPPRYLIDDSVRLMAKRLDANASLA